ncbi:hypothetical protein ACI3EY_16545 [Ornithinimicrobium sp. LYQ92]|uniref:hypothetical protein n=1 Tax=Serinicoccus sp. LYQ92 TaxID=3378798 RepID=UPI003854D219
MNWFGPIATVAGFLITGAFAVWVARIQRKETPYDALSNRVMRLESSDAEKGDLIQSQTRRLRMLEEDTHMLVDALTEQEDWQEAGADPPPPRIDRRVLEILRRHRKERARLDEQARLTPHAAD